MLLISSMMAVIVVVLPWLALPVNSTRPLVAAARSLITLGSRSSPRVRGRSRQDADHGADVAVEVAHVHAIPAVIVDGHEVVIQIGMKLLPLGVAQQLERQPLALLRSQRVGRRRHEFAGNAKQHRGAGAT